MRSTISWKVLIISISLIQNILWFKLSSDLVNTYVSIYEIQPLWAYIPLAKLLIIMQITRRKEHYHAKLFVARFSTNRRWKDDKKPHHALLFFGFIWNEIINHKTSALVTACYGLFWQKLCENKYDFIMRW